MPLPCICLLFACFHQLTHASLFILQEYLSRVEWGDNHSKMPLKSIFSSQGNKHDEDKLKSTDFLSTFLRFHAPHFDRIGEIKEVVETRDFLVLVEPTLASRKPMSYWWENDLPFLVSDTKVGQEVLLSEMFRVFSRASCKVIWSSSSNQEDDNLLSCNFSSNPKFVAVMPLLLYRTLTVELMENVSECKAVEDCSYTVTKGSVITVDRRETLLLSLFMA